MRPGTWGNGMPAGAFRCPDGELMLVVGNDGQFARTCGVLGAPELAADPRFVKSSDRVVRGKEIMAIFAGLFLKKFVARDRAAGINLSPRQPCRLAKIRGRGAEVTAEGTVEIGDIAESAFVGDLCDVEVSVPRVDQHAVGLHHAFGEDEGGE